MKGGGRWKCEAAEEREDADEADAAGGGKPGFSRSARRQAWEQ